MNTPKKKVTKRGWSEKKFVDSVKAAAKAKGVAVDTTAVKKAYADLWSVPYTVYALGKAAPTRKKAA